MYLHICSKVVDDNSPKFDFGPFEFLKSETEKFTDDRLQQEPGADPYADVWILGGREVSEKNIDLDQKEINVILIHCFVTVGGRKFTVAIDGTSFAYLTNDVGRTIRKICLD